MNRPVPTTNNSHHNLDGYAQQSIFKVDICNKILFFVENKIEK
jgi:hypothetical protein